VGTVVNGGRKGRPDANRERRKVSTTKQPSGHGAKSTSDAVATSFAIDQVVVGSRQVLPQQERVPCGVVATSTAQWLWIADTLGYDPEWCWLGDAFQDESWLRSAYPKTAFIRDVAWVQPVTVVFCDGQPPQFVYRLHTLAFIFHLKTQRRKFEHWQTHLVRLRHSNLGGLTLLNSVLLCSTGVHRHYHDAAVADGLASCVYTVASDTLDAGTRARPPLVRRLGEARVARLGANLFHGGKLYPIGEPRPVFLLPSVYQPTGWCKRRLTVEEEWMVYDVPHRITSLLWERAASSVHQDFKKLVPGRCLEKGVRHFMTAFSVVPETRPSKCKRVREQVDFGSRNVAGNERERLSRGCQK
jgi:hypothetical protein